MKPLIDKEDTKLISVMMPAYKIENHRPLFVKALSGIVNQTYTNWELIIACDSGQKRTIGCVKEEVIKLNDSRIRVMTSEKRHGSGIIRNMIYPYTKGSYLVFHDSDDFSTPLRFEKMVAAIDGCGVVASNIMVNNMYIGQAATKRKKSYSGENYDILINDRKVKVPICMSAAMITREVFERMGGFEEYLYSTEPTFAIKLGYLRAMTNEGPIPIIDDALYVWNRHSLSVTTQFANNYAVKKCQSKQRKPLKRAFRDKILGRIINIGDEEDIIKQAMGIINNFAGLKKLYPEKVL